jgi:hypothetical protein
MAFASASITRKRKYYYSTERGSRAVSARHLRRLANCGEHPVQKRYISRRKRSRERNKCHENVDRFVAENPDYKAVRGWISINAWIRDAHSIVEGPGGERFDITPFEPESCRSATRFAEHMGDEESFQGERAYQGQFYWTCPRHPEMALTAEPAPLIEADDLWSENLSEWS